MKEKKFVGWVDGHFVKGTLTDKDEVDFQREREEGEKNKGKGVTVGKVIGAAVIGALILGLGSSTKDSGSK